jgi:H+-translocating NAD(P) transhydrogenase subunit alpha
MPAFSIAISTHEFGTMRPLTVPVALALVLLLAIASQRMQRSYGNPPFGNPPANQEAGAGSETALAANPTPGGIANPVYPVEKPSSNRVMVLVGSLTVFVLSIFIGFEIIAKVPPTLHTPLMSGSNAISGITVIGAIIASGYKETGIGSLLGLVAVVLAMINVVGGFVVTHRMLLMFKKR